MGGQKRGNQITNAEGSCEAGRAFQSNNRQIRIRGWFVGKSRHPAPQMGFPRTKFQFSSINRQLTVNKATMAQSENILSSRSAEMMGNWKDGRTSWSPWRCTIRLSQSMSLEAKAVRQRSTSHWYHCTRASAMRVALLVLLNGGFDQFRIEVA